MPRDVIKQHFGLCQVQTLLVTELTEPLAFLLVCIVITELTERLALLLVCIVTGQLQLSRYGDSLRAGRPGDRIPVGDEIFPLYLPWGSHNHLYSEHRVFPGGKAAETWNQLPTPSSAEVKE